MKRYDAIEKVSKSILEEGLVEALFLKGSIARNEDDDFSDVDMYAVISKENEELFLKNRIHHMEAYMPLVYWSETDFVGPQIVGVYENALHFDLYTVKVSSIPNTDHIKILYDKRGILKSYERESLSIDSSDVSVYFNEFTFSLLEFESAYNRGDLIWATRLASHLTADIAMILAYIYNHENSKLGAKRIYRYLPEELRNQFVEILNNLTPNLMNVGVKNLVEFADELMNSLPAKITKDININFFRMMHERVCHL